MQCENSVHPNYQKWNETERGDLKQSHIHALQKKMTTWTESERLRKKKKRVKTKGVKNEKQKTSKETVS